MKSHTFAYVNNTKSHKQVNVDLQYQINGRQVGYITLVEQIKTGVLMLSTIKVDRKYRKQGIGTALMYRAIQDYGNRMMELVVIPFDRGLGYGGLLAFYAKFGFRLTKLEGFANDNIMVRSPV